MLLSGRHKFCNALTMSVIRQATCAICWKFLVEEKSITIFRIWPKTLAVRGENPQVSC